MRRSSMLQTSLAVLACVALVPQSEAKDVTLVRKGRANVAIFSPLEREAPKDEAKDTPACAAWMALTPTCSLLGFRCPVTRSRERPFTNGATLCSGTRRLDQDVDERAPLSTAVASMPEAGAAGQKDKGGNLASADPPKRDGPPNGARITRWIALLMAAG